MKPFYFVFLALALIACDTTTDVEYSVSGTANRVDITIENQSGGTSQFADETLPWTYRFESQPGAFVYVSAQNQTETGTVTVEIKFDGTVVKRSSSSGAYVIATASGTVE